MVRGYARVIWTLLLVLALSSTPNAWAGAPPDEFRDGADRVFKILGDLELKGARESQPALGNHRQGFESLRRGGTIASAIVYWIGGEPWLRTRKLIMPFNGSAVLHVDAARPN
jgi:hypothetical protein